MLCREFVRDIEGRGVPCEEASGDRSPPGEPGGVTPGKGIWRDGVMLDGDEASAWP